MAPRERRPRNNGVNKQGGSQETAQGRPIKSRDRRGEEALQLLLVWRRQLQKGMATW